MSTRNKINPSVVHNFSNVVFWTDVKGCLSTNIFEHTRLTFHATKIFPCRYKSVTHEVRFMCDPSSFGELDNSKIQMYSTSKYLFHPERAHDIPITFTGVDTSVALSNWIFESTEYGHSDLYFTISLPDTRSFFRLRDTRYFSSLFLTLLFFCFG